VSEKVSEKSEKNQEIMQVESLSTDSVKAVLAGPFQMMLRQ
jgi:hypothetical protein